MKSLAHASAAAPHSPNIPTPPTADETCPEASGQPAGPLRPQYLLVEDADYFAQTGVLRQVLVIRWIR